MTTIGIIYIHTIYIYYISLYPCMIDCDHTNNMGTLLAALAMTCLQTRWLALVLFVPHIIVLSRFPNTVSGRSSFYFPPTLMKSTVQTGEARVTDPPGLSGVVSSEYVVEIDSDVSFICVNHWYLSNDGPGVTF